VLVKAPALGRKSGPLLFYVIGAYNSNGPLFLSDDLRPDGNYGYYRRPDGRWAPIHRSAEGGVSSATVAPE
jgi:hypothetical protein